MTPTQTDVAAAAERVVADWLAGAGYDTNIDVRAAGSVDLEAREPDGTRHLIQVRAAVAPEEPAGLTADEELAVRNRASWLGCRAWEARVRLDARLRPAAAIEWRELN